jgi:hypothetical protein
MVAAESKAVIHILKLNIECGAGSYYIDHLIEETEKSEGRKNKFDNFLEMFVDKHSEEEAANKAIEERKKVAEGRSTSTIVL